MTDLEIGLTGLKEVIKVKWFYKDGPNPIGQVL